MSPAGPFQRHGWTRGWTKSVRYALSLAVVRLYDVIDRRWPSLCASLVKVDCDLHATVLATGPTGAVIHAQRPSATAESARGSQELHRNLGITIGQRLRYDGIRLWHQFRHMTRRLPQDLFSYDSKYGSHCRIII